MSTLLCISSQLLQRFLKKTCQRHMAQKHLRPPRRQLPEVTARQKAEVALCRLAYVTEMRKGLTCVEFFPYVSICFHMFPYFRQVSVRFPSGFRYFQDKIRCIFWGPLLQDRWCSDMPAPSAVCKARADTWGVTTVTTWHTKPVTHGTSLKPSVTQVSHLQGPREPSRNNALWRTLQSDLSGCFTSTAVRHVVSLPSFALFWDDNSLKLTAHPLKHPRRQKWSVSFVKFPPLKSGHPLRPVLSIDLHSKAGLQGIWCRLSDLERTSGGSGSKISQIGRSCHILP